MSAVGSPSAPPVTLRQLFAAPTLGEVMARQRRLQRLARQQQQQELAGAADSGSSSSGGGGSLQPLVVRLTSAFVQEPGGRDWPPPPLDISASGRGRRVLASHDDGSDDGAASSGCWVWRAAQLAAAASGSSDCSTPLPRSSRLVVVNPGDGRRVRRNEALEEALRSNPPGTTSRIVAIEQLAHAQLVAVRDVHVRQPCFWWWPACVHSCAEYHAKLSTDG